MKAWISPTVWKRIYTNNIFSFGKDHENLQISSGLVLALTHLNSIKFYWSGRGDLNTRLPAPKLSAPVLPSVPNQPIWYVIQDVGPFGRFRLVDVISSNRVWFRFVASTKSSINSVRQLKNLFLSFVVWYSHQSLRCAYFPQSPCRVTPDILVGVCGGSNERIHRSLITNFPQCLRRVPSNITVGDHQKTAEIYAGHIETGTKKQTDYLAGFWADKLDIIEGYESTPASVNQKK